jgi:diacylglycerol kinase family enzyme
VLLAKSMAGRASGSWAFEIIAAARATIDTRRARHIPVATDGEVVTLGTPLAYQSRPGALRVVVPRP